MECDCTVKKLTKRTIKGGALVYQLQCDNCFSSVGSFIGHEKVAELKRNGMTVFDYDEESKIEYKKTKNQHWQDVRENQNEEARREKELWWEKYSEYLQSTKWKVKRALVLEKAHHTCECCLTERATIVHHLSYANVFNEYLGELAATCKPCHDLAHAKGGK